MTQSKANERPVRCPKCRALVGATPDGKRLRPAGQDAVGVIEAEKEPLELGCVACGHWFTLKDARRAEGH